MKIIRNKHIPFKGFAALNILGVLFVREDAEMTAEALNHEAIHTRQQRELLVLSLIIALPFASWWSIPIAIVMPFILYILAWLVELVLPPYGTAYKDSPFEREAYANQYYPNYLDSRPLFAWVRYILKER